MGFTRKKKPWRAGPCQDTNPVPSPTSLLEEKEKPKKIRVIVFKEDPDQIGNGHYKMLACFIELGVHIPYTIYVHSENIYVDDIGKPTTCDSSCESRHGKIEDWSKERHRTDHDVKRIIEKATTFSARRESHAR